MSQVKLFVYISSTYKQQGITNLGSLNLIVVSLNIALIPNSHHILE